MYSNCKLFSNTCCVCLDQTNPDVFRITNFKQGSTMTWISKLQDCVQQVRWSQEDLICRTCSDQLDTVYKFHQLCYKSHEARTKAISSLPLSGTQCQNASTKYACELKSSNVIVDVSGIFEKQITEYFCKACCLGFVGKAELDDHQIKVHVKEKIEGDISVEENNRVIEPNYCNDGKSKVDCNIVKDNFLCVLCGSAFSKCAKFIKHSVTEHGIDKSEIRPYACTKCSKKYYNSTLLKEHYAKSHETFRTEMCVYCSKTFSTRRALNKHEKIHENKRAYQCGQCPKRFNTVNSRLSHKMTVHADPSKWKYLCGLCNKRFYSKSNMDTHLRRHKQDKPFACHLCDKRFCHSTDLRLHIPSHTNIREFKCSECNREYKRERDLKMHMAKDHRIDNGVKVYVKKRKHVCNLCPKTFCSNEKLIRHMCSHTGDKPFPCTACDKRFTDKWYATQHMKSVHDLVPGSD